MRLLPQTPDLVPSELSNGKEVRRYIGLVTGLSQFAQVLPLFLLLCLICRHSLHEVDELAHVSEGVLWIVEQQKKVYIKVRDIMNLVTASLWFRIFGFIAINLYIKIVKGHVEVLLAVLAHQ